MPYLTSTLGRWRGWVLAALALYVTVADLLPAAILAGGYVYWRFAIDQLRDIEGFAAQVAAMDHVVTISTVAAHLAGALGRPGSVLLPRARGLKWQWMLERPDSPWYPSLRLYRQSTAGDWADVFQRIERDVVEMVPPA